MRKLVSLLVIIMVMAGVSIGLVAAQDTVTGYVVHGIPGLAVDIYVDGELFAEDFQPGTIAGPLVGPANTFADVAIVPANGDPANPALSANVGFDSGQNVSIVAHLDESGTPTLSIFENNVSETDQARLIIRHVAAAPAVDAIFFPGEPNQIRVGPLANGEEIASERNPGEYTAGLAPAGTDTIVYGPETMDLRGGKTYIAYAIGSLDDGSFDVLLQTIDS